MYQAPASPTRPRPAAGASSNSGRMEARRSTAPNETCGCSFTRRRGTLVIWSSDLGFQRRRRLRRSGSAQHCPEVVIQQPVRRIELLSRLHEKFQAVSKGLASNVTGNAEGLIEKRLSVAIAAEFVKLC